MKKMGLGLAATTLLFALAGCGFKMDASMLSKDGGVWKMSNVGYAQFNEEGEGTLYSSSKEKMGTFSYEVADKKDDYQLTLDPQFTGNDSAFDLDGDLLSMTVTVPKKDQSNDEFTGKLKSKVLGGASPSAKVTFKHEKASVLE